MALEGLIILIIVGAIAGWLAGQIVKGMGFGLIGNIVVGIVGAFVGTWLLGMIGVHIGGGPEVYHDFDYPNAGVYGTRYFGHWLRYNADAATRAATMARDFLAEKLANEAGHQLRPSIWIGIIIGSTMGEIIPWLWGDGVLPYSSVIMSGVGAVAELRIGQQNHGVRAGFEAISRTLTCPHPNPRFRPLLLKELEFKSADRSREAGGPRPTARCALGRQSVLHGRPWTAD